MLLLFGIAGELWMSTTFQGSVWVVVLWGEEISGIWDFVELGFCFGFWCCIGRACRIFDSAKLSVCFWFFQVSRFKPGWQVMR